MPEQCGCRTVEAFRTSAGFATDAEIIYCPLHARAAEMRELLERANNIFLVYADATDGEGLRFSNEWRKEARALLEATHA